MDVNRISEFYHNKRVLITGATGLKGAWLAAMLSELGAIVTNISLDDAEPKSAFISLGLSKKIYNEFVDIRDAKALSMTITGLKPDIVFHFAAEALVIDSFHNPEKTFQTNLIGSLNLYEALRWLDNECVLITATTDKVYDNKNLGIEFSEEHPIGYSDPYSTSKSMVELLSGCYYHSFFSSSEKNIRMATVRAGNIIGPGDWSVNRLLPDIARAIFYQKELLLRNPKSTRPWQFVSEAIKGYILLGYHLSKCGPTFTSYNFGPRQGDAVSTRDIVEIASKDYAFSYKIDEGAEFKEQQFLELNSQKAQNEIGFRPVYSVKERVKLTLSGYAEIIRDESLCKTLSKVLDDF